MFLDELFRLAPGEESERQKFEQLATATFDALDAPGHPVGPFDLWADLTKHPLLPDALIEQWKEWKTSFKALLERNPCLEVYDMMHQIAETHQAASWPYYMEEGIQDWLDGGDISAMPFVDMKGIVTAGFYSRLRELRRKINGWLYYSEIGVVFLREARWQQLRRDSKRTGYLAGRGRSAKWAKATSRRIARFRAAVKAAMRT
jgi:hypothetical protein